MKKLLFGLLLFSGFAMAKAGVKAPDEGMWLPMFVERLNYVDMQKQGLHLTAKEIYDINNSSLKDAIVSLGFFCTGEMVSSEGLMFTNHHCGYGAIQANSSINHDYLKDGFWAMNKNEELYDDQLSAFFLVRMEDVTQEILKNVSDTMSETNRANAIEGAIAVVKDNASEDEKYTVNINSFFGGNEYYMFVYEKYSDVRLVGAPPEAIGKFGGDTDNWMWPRHTGDFCVLRVYMSPDGKPAPYSKDNVPYKPKHFLPISLKGVEKNDYAMIMGYPGSTDRFLTSLGVKLTVEESNPTKVMIRDKKLATMKEDMDTDNGIRIKYASKYAQTANYWKYFIGQTKGLKRLKVYDEKLALENEFTNWVNADESRKEKYGKALDYIKEGYDIQKKYNIANIYFEEAAFQGPELLYFSFNLMKLNSQLKAEKVDKDKIDKTILGLKKKAKEFYKDFNLPTEKKLFANLMQMYYKNVPKDLQPTIFETVENKFDGDFAKYGEKIFAKSFLVSEEKLNKFLEKPSYKAIEKDPIFAFMWSILNKYYENSYSLEMSDELINKGNRLFIDGLRKMKADKKFSPDANSTMRLTYGNVNDYIPADAVHYDFTTTADGIIEKEDPKNEEFIVPTKLKELILKKDYGRYADKNGKLITCFITNNDITGGNSGSPVINGKGELIGIAFDGNWEAMSGDIAFEKDYQRTICADIRYVLFVIDKYAGASHLIKELKIVE